MENTKSLLLVEDEYLVASVTEKALKDKGYEIQHVANGSEAIHAVVDETAPIDLILMDINLGTGIDGVQTAREILAERNIPIMFYSSVLTPKYVHESEDLLSYGYIDKCTSITVLDAMIRKAIALFNEKQESDNECKELQRRVFEKETLLNEVHHRVKNDIFQVEGFLYLQMDATKASQVKVALADTLARVKSIRVLHETLLQADRYNEVPLKNYIQSILREISQIHAGQKEITLGLHLDDMVISSKKALVVGILVNELLNNAYKYAFKGRASGNVELIVKLTEDESRRVSLTVHDDGMGIETEEIESSKKGIGLALVRMLVSQLEGSLHIANQGGTKVLVEFNH